MPFDSGHFELAANGLALDPLDALVQLQRESAGCPNAQDVSRVLWKQEIEAQFRRELRAALDAAVAEDVASAFG